MADAAPSRAGRIFMALAVVLTLFGVATGRVVLSGEDELNKSNIALTAKDPRAAIVHARRSAGWYAPGAPHVAVAYERLVALAVAAEENRNDELALLAWRSVREASTTTRWLLRPHHADRERADQEIARLTAKRPRQVEPDRATMTARFQELATRQGHHPGWGLVLVASFAVSAAGFGWWSRQVAGAGGRVDWKAARGGLLLVVIGAVTWLLTVWRS